MVVQLLTGIGILLFGVNTLSSSFEKLCGGKIKTAINKYSSSWFGGSTIGILLTLLLQSSTASGILVAGLSGVGVITLMQSIPLIIGNNVGGSLSLFLVAFQGINLIGYFCLLTLIGIFMKLAFKNKTVKNWGMCLCGLGLLFTGLSFMSSATETLSSSQTFLNIISSIQNPFVLILIGIVGTIILQSSLGMMAVVAPLVGTSVVTGIMSVYSASFIIFGMNIGTCLTLLVVGATTNRESLRTALSHLIFNVTGCIIFSLISIYDWVTPCTSFIGNPTIQIIIVDVIFNVSTAILMLLLLKPLTKFLMKIVPKEKRRSRKTISQPVNQEIATLAVVQLSKNATTLFSETADILEQAMLYILSDAISSSKNIRKQIERILEQNDEMQSKLLGVTGEISEDDKQTISKLNTFFVGIKKANVNIQKLLNSCEDNDKKYNFTQKQDKFMSDIQILMLDNLQDMRLMMDEDYLNIENKETKDMINKIIERLEKIVTKKIQAKQSVVQSSITEQSTVTKYTAFLNVINYFEQINTNLTDIIIEIISSKNFNNETMQIDKIQNS